MTDQPGVNHESVCACFPALKKVTLDREARYTEDPTATAPQGPQSTVEVAVRSVGELNELASSLKSGRTWVISEPVHVGGLADAPTPLEYLLSGAMGCFAAVFAFYAAKWDVKYDTFEASAKADLDVRGHMMEDAPPSGFRRVTIHVDIGVSEKPDQEALDRVMQAAMQGCPGISTLKDPVHLEANMNVCSTPALIEVQR
jgi:uncharacterized OsmC-like protein